MRLISCHIETAAEWTRMAGTDNFEAAFVSIVKEGSV